jgi:hypothetical protein
MSTFQTARATRFGPVGSPDSTGPVSGAFDTLARVTDGYFRDPTTGKVILVEKPNAKIKAVGVLRAALTPCAVFTW